ncbi:MAG: pilus assembly protein [Clostridiaceae bacterium]|nr:pilus assembly protein [Clostridiaceae bacterium]
MGENKGPIRRFLINHFKKSCKGAVTVEYALIFPPVIFCVFILIFIGLVFYQQALLQSVVSENVQNCALLWGYDFNKLELQEGIVNKESYLSEELYWHIFSKADRKKLILQDNIRKQMKKRSILKPSGDVDVEVSFHNYFLVQKVGFKAEMAYKLPFESLIRFFGLPDNIKIRAYSEIVIHDPKEFIHNVDYMLQIYEESGAGELIREKCKPLLDALNKIKSFIN